MQTDVNGQNANTGLSLTPQLGSTAGATTTTNLSGTERFKVDRALMEANERLKAKLAEQKRAAKNKQRESVKSLKDLFRSWSETPGWKPQDESSRECAAKMFREQERVERQRRLFLASGVPPRHREQTIDLQYSPAGWANWHQTLLENIGVGFLYAISGTRGTGKTQLATCLIREACNRLKVSKYVWAYKMLLEVRESNKSDGDSESAAIGRMVEPDVLVIDEINVRLESEFEARTITQIIDERYAYKRDTFIIGNLTGQAFADSIGPSVYSRIVEAGGIIECNWSSFRESQI